MTKTWIVTGSSRGLGRVLVEAILDAGDQVAATARKPEQLNDLLQKYGPTKLYTTALDVTNVTQVQEAIRAIHQHFGTIDVVVNNAGYADVASIEDITLQSFRTQFETNFFGVVNMTKAVLPYLRTQGYGHIVQISSIGGRLGSPGLSSYQSAKWALNGFSTVLASEVAPLGIKVTVLEPGGMNTDWAGSSMSVPPISEPYKQTVGAFAKMRENSNNLWDAPEPYARAILHVAGLEDPPLRLVLGKEALGYAKMLGQQLADSDAKWESVSMLNV